eukprot:CAMPEP_0203786390 /NCGR_PEP_ID=MMETSP0100_2-20121128/1596_1 /ASSEMBLY_ACC=CAM_ASM_000210 /TAXON_ID=96639 /ORGANISM=" , Strain NY0313808BC1" /LENGTH=444 /DNA_ID=CAMNT_0050688679 /DNA_START=1339 /DNA_END=2673 /DNA_ORIENTATION=+
MSVDGEHHTSSLKCGHVYGRRCIEKWIRIKKKYCPQCHQAATKRDIRQVFMPTGETLVDTRQEADLLRQLEAERAKRVLVETELAKMRQLRKKDTFANLERTDASQQVCLLRPPDPIKKAKRVLVETELAKARQIETKDNLVNLDRGRVGAMLASTDSICVSSHASLVVYNLSKCSTETVLPQHSNSVRDIKVQCGMVLSCSLDKTTKLFKARSLSRTAVISIQCPSPVWSCEFLNESGSIVSCGLLNGTLLNFDLRKSNTPLSQTRKYCKTPIHSLHRVETNVLLVGALKEVAIASFNRSPHPTHVPLALSQSSEPFHLCTNVQLSQASGLVTVSCSRPTPQHVVYCLSSILDNKPLVIGKGMGHTCYPKHLSRTYIMDSTKSIYSVNAKTNSLYSWDVENSKVNSFRDVGPQITSDQTVFDIFQATPSGRIALVTDKSFRIM